jgi:TRAP-type mannitol/chloroaromatic compound transport system permease small subunit
VKHPAAEQSSNLWRAIDAVGSRQGLLVALLVLVLVARFAAGGLLRDALRRTRSTASP